ncbi:hypothetical protein [Rhizobium lentis]|uniref:Uncharacterized protein n=1 Tax=Rhizobium lentis TaxID=1138194 RepID=A0A7W8XH88_9HYPH|nr:hypothetical protein [Rhizobium lentis]MBB4576246.1 hypothetical protein [Rhizobium lentis]MBB5552555.1 hypothetical protein [Rhizobium lentis]MBB5562835.1 hypothetical protein [Rhizobium lentis]MBB5569372.1 hypothetical protein [Rhizobium lentis]
MSKTPKFSGNAKIGGLTQARAEKISAVEGLVLSPRMRRFSAKPKISRLKNVAKRSASSLHVSRPEGRR